MATYVGFSTQFSGRQRITSFQNGVGGGVGTLITPLSTGKKFKLTDRNLVVVDFINALNIPQGQKPGNPGYGTSIWEFIFEPNNGDTSRRIESEMRRVASLDPRLLINNINIKQSEHVVLIEMEVAILPFEEVDIIQIMFDQLNNRATFA